MNVGVRCWRPDGRSSVWLGALAALAVGALLGGCGTNEREEFRENQLNPLVRRASEERATLAAVLRVSQPGRGRDAAALRDQLRAVTAVYRRIASLSPPDGTGERFERYVRANAALLGALRRFVAAFARRDDAAQEDAGRAASTALTRANRAQRGLQRSLR